ncbi:MAG: hypothetical protein AUI14_12190 [Actinobacteria bacterium 13_2_20CM_2_71_6]|nr:MAG: hypothetical protein AUI14_12190 [Actinobacteria bacterium 13_2_20CM_2_71_6]
MFRTKRSRLAATIAAAAVFGTAGALAAAQMAQAHDGTDGSPPAGAAVDTTGPATFLVASLSGRNEIPGPAGSPAVNDPDGQAVTVVRIKGNQVSFAIKWKNIAAPTAGHIHLGATGVNGGVQVPFFGAGLADNLEAAVGSVTVTDQALLDSLKANPTGFYANLHTGEFPGGAVRGQLHTVTHAVDLDAVLRGGPLSALLSGDQEVPGPKPAGDPDGHATAYVAADDNKVNFAFTWSGIGAPTDGHIHEGVVGGNGPVVQGLFSSPTGLPASVSGVAGVVKGVKSDLVRKIRNNPNNFYANLHTAEFSGGAVRGQLFRSGGGNDDRFDQSTFVASVVKGEQIYACTKQADGTFAFTQHNVSATLQTGIAHSFVKDDAGPPQWVSRDHSAVTGKLISKSANGAGNIAELDLDATQSGDSDGQLANTVEILRLNTVGGVAPAGTCDPQKQPIAKVPYQADYVFISK